MKKKTFIWLLVIMLLVISLFTVLEVKGKLHSDILSNAIGTLAGGVLSILFVFWQLELDKQRRAKQDIINLLNLIDEFPSLVSEEYLKNFLRDIADDDTEFRAMYGMLNPYLNELHKSIDQAETSLILLGKNNQGVKEFLQTANLVQIELREFIQIAQKYESVVKKPKAERVKAAIHLEKKKEKVIEKLKNLVDLLKSVSNQEKSLREIDFQGIAQEVYLFADGYDQVYQKLLELIDTGAIKPSKDKNYSQKSFTGQVASVVPVIKEWQVRLPEINYRHYERKGMIAKNKGIIEQVLLYKALTNKIEFVQMKKGDLISYSIKFK